MHSFLYPLYWLLCCRRVSYMRVYSSNSFQHTCVGSEHYCACYYFYFYLICSGSLPSQWSLRCLESYLGFTFFFSHLSGWKYYEIFRELDTYFCGKLKEDSKTGSVLYYVYIFYFKAVVETNRSLFQASGIGWCLVSTI